MAGLLCVTAFAVCKLDCLYLSAGIKSMHHHAQFILMVRKKPCWSLKENEAEDSRP